MSTSNEFFLTRNELLDMVQVGVKHSSVFKVLADFASSFLAHTKFSRVTLWNTACHPSDGQ